MLFSWVNQCFFALRSNWTTTRNVIVRFELYFHALVNRTNRNASPHRYPSGSVYPNAITCQSRNHRHSFSTHLVVPVDRGGGSGQHVPSLKGRAMTWPWPVLCSRCPPNVSTASGSQLSNSPCISLPCTALPGRNVQSFSEGLPPARTPAAGDKLASDAAPIRHTTPATVRHRGSLTLHCLLAP